VVNSNLGLSRTVPEIGPTATYWLTITNFCTSPFRISEKSFTDPKTRVLVAVHGDDFVILACVVLTQEVNR